MAKPGYVYILTNAAHTVLYTGVTSDLAQRMRQHREGKGSAFVARYRARRLVYYESYDQIGDAIAREKQIKGGSRGQKVGLIKAANPDWRDLAEDFL